MILEKANEFEPYAKKKKAGNQLEGKVLATIFYEPSTRTRLSHEVAMQRLGGRVISVTGMEDSSLTKGETLSDSAQVISRFADIIAIRHPEVGSAEEFSKGSMVPVINAGDGIGQHPTQALQDLYTIKKELGKLDGITVGFSGDLKFGRTPNSLSYLLSNYDIKQKFIAPAELKMKDEVKEYLSEKDISFEETEDFEEGIRDVDVLYVTRVQQERFKNKEDYEKLKDVYILNRKLIGEKNLKMIVMHPLPRVNEISTDVDSMPNAAYFKQVENGIAIRMAIISSHLLTPT